MKAVQFLTIILFIFVVPVKCQISNKSDQVLKKYYPFIGPLIVFSKLIIKIS